MLQSKEFDLSQMKMQSDVASEQLQVSDYVTINIIDRSTRSFAGDVDTSSESWRFQRGLERENKVYSLWVVFVKGVFH